MRLVSFVDGGAERFGAVTDGGVADLTGWRGAGSIAAVLRQGLLRSLAEEAARRRPDRARDTLTLLPPVPAPRAIFCIGVNYQNRNAEYQDGSEAPAYPSVFMRVPESFTGHGQPLIRPRQSEQLDYEGEIALVIGKAGRHIAADAALGHIAGLTLANEGSVRDWLRHSKFNVTQGKNFDRSGAMGPWLVTADALDLTQPLRLMTRVNGETRQDASTADMIFSFARLIAYLSSFATLLPGDVILTGTPTGAGARFDPPKWLKPEDVVEVEVGGIGVLRNSVADEGAD